MTDSMIERVARAIWNTKPQNDQDMALHVERLQAELDELENGVTTDEDGLRTAGAVNHGGRQ